MSRPIANVMTESQIERFWSYVSKTDSGCWMWSKATNAVGYGVYGVWRGGRTPVYLAHRIAYYLITGIDPLEKFVCHTCDNPPCCNPEHLFLGTQKDNMADCSRKGRATNGAAQGRGGNRKITADIVRQLRARYTAGEKIGTMSTEVGLTFTSVWNVVTGRTWKNVT